MKKSQKQCRVGATAFWDLVTIISGSVCEAMPYCNRELSPRGSLEVGKTYKGGISRNQKRHRRTARIALSSMKLRACMGACLVWRRGGFFVSTALIRVSDRAGQDRNHQNPARMRIRHP